MKTTATTSEPRESVELKLIHSTGGVYATRIETDENSHTVLQYVRDYM